MCNHTTDCQKPDQIESSPAECSKEQIRTCHGETKVHPCEKED